MRNDLTDITMVIDRSGSMRSCRGDAEGGINHFIDEQKAAPGEANLTMVQFDSVVEVVHSGKPIKDVPPYSLKPRNMTALLDAVGRAINETGKRLSDMAEADRPGFVVFLIVTDGAENSSKGFTLPQIQEMIKLQQDTYNWKFVFLGADAASFSQAGAMGICRGTSAQYDANNSMATYATVSSRVSGARMGGVSGEWNEANGGPVMDFSEDDRAKMLGEVPVSA